MAARLTLADNSKAAEASNTLCIDPTMHLRRGYQNFLPRDSAYERKPRIAIESARTLMDNLGGLFRSEPAFLARVLHPRGRPPFSGSSANSRNRTISALIALIPADENSRRVPIGLRGFTWVRCEFLQLWDGGGGSRIFRPVWRSSAILGARCVPHKPLLRSA
jgi:hypothetical protein